jgi:hypothetical protein
MNVITIITLGTSYLQLFLLIKYPKKNMKNLIFISLISILTLTSADYQTQFKIDYSYLSFVDIYGKANGPLVIPYTFVFNSDKFTRFSNDGENEKFNIISSATVNYSNGYRFQFFMALDGDGDEVKVSLFDNPKIGLYLGYPQGNVLHFHN